MKCEYCGRRVKDEAEFCLGCGAPVDGQRIPLGYYYGVPYYDKTSLNEVMFVHDILESNLDLSVPGGVFHQSPVSPQYTTAYTTSIVANTKPR